MSEIPVHPRPRRLADWINPTGAKKVHSLVDKVYKRKNLEMAWEKVQANRGSGGVDGQSLEDFEVQLDQQLDRLHRELHEDAYRPQPVRQVPIPKAGKPGEFRTLGIPTIYDRVCQQALLNRLEPIFEPVFDEANFGYRRGRSTKDALRKVWKEIESGREWIVDADLKDFFGSVDHEKLLTLVAQQVADGRVLRLIEAMLKAGSYGRGRLSPTERGTPQGGVVSPLLSNILLTPFDREMRRTGYQLTRYADDWVVTCRTARRRRKQALPPRNEILSAAGRATASAEDADRARPTRIRVSGVQDQARQRAAVACPGQDSQRCPARERSTRIRREKSIQHFKDQVAAADAAQGTADDRGADRGTESGHCGAGASTTSEPTSDKLFNRLDAGSCDASGRIGSSVGATCGWKQLPRATLYGEFGLVNLIRLIPSTCCLAQRIFVKAACGKTARAV